MENKQTVLVTAIGSFAADTVIRELKEAGYRVIGSDIYDPKWVAASQDVEAFYQAPLAKDEKKYIDFIKDIVAKEHVTRIVPLIDVEVDVLNRHRAEIETDAVRICMSDEEVITTLRDKLLMTKLVAGVISSIDDPDMKGQVRTIPTEKASEIDFEHVSYPVVLKPVDGRSSSGLYRVYQEDQLGFAFSNIMDPTKLNDTALDNYLVQPLIKGNVITVDIVRDREGHVSATPREELLRTANGAGLSVRVFRDPVLEDICKRIADRAGIVGCVNFEFIHGAGSGVYYFIECNPRYSGGVAFTEMAGVHVVKASMRIFDGESMGDIGDPREGYMTRKYLEISMS